MESSFCYKMLVAYVFLLWSFGLCGCQGNPNYVINFDSPIYVYGEGSSDYIDASRVIVENYNESVAFMHGEIEFLKGIDSAVLELILQKEASGKLEVMMSHDICDLCKELGDEESDYKKYLRYFGIPESCPFDAGSYKILNFVCDTDDFQLTSQNVGKYEAELNMYKKTGESCKNDRELLFTLKINLSIEQE